MNFFANCEKIAATKFLTWISLAAEKTRPITPGCRPQLLVGKMNKNFCCPDTDCDSPSAKRNDDCSHHKGKASGFVEWLGDGLDQIGLLERETTKEFYKNISSLCLAGDFSWESPKMWSFVWNVSRIF